MALSPEAKRKIAILLAEKKKQSGQPDAHPMETLGKAPEMKFEVPKLKFNALKLKLKKAF